MNSAPVTFGRYKLVNLLGEGGMAKVFRAVLSGPMGFEKEVALKRIDPRLTADERIVKALINEARLGGQLRHKNIVEIYEFNQVDGNYYMAMEYVDGWTLDGVVRRIRARGEFIPPSVVVEILMSVCRGLDYAHSLKDKTGLSMNLVHRDLKPGNIILSRQGDVKIMDFGIAKSDSNLYKTTAADVTKGTPIYMSPEQVTGGKLDARSDIFSLGSVLHELVTNEVPFQGDNLLAIMHLVLNADIGAARMRVADRAPDLEVVLGRCMARDREQRYSTVSEVERHLREIRRKVDGPSLLDWVEEVGVVMPAPVRAGEFGPDGAPQAIVAGTQSLASIETIPAEDSLWQTGDAAAMSHNSDTLAIRSPGRPTPAPIPTPGAMGALTKDFFKTQGDSEPPPPGPPLTPAAPAPVLPGSTGEVSRTRVLKAANAAGRPKKQGGSIGLIASVGGGVVFLLIGVLVWLLRTPGTTTPTASPPPVVSAPTPAPTPTTPTPDLTQVLTPRPLVEPTPAPRVPPKESKTTATKEPVRSQKTPAPVTTPTPAPVAREPAGTAFLKVNAKPWATITLDGRSLRNTPANMVEIPSGRHTLRLDCGNCNPSKSESFEFEVKPGETWQKFHTFEATPP